MEQVIPQGVPQGVPQAGPQEGMPQMPGGAMPEGMTEEQMRADIDGDLKGLKDRKADIEGMKNINKQDLSVKKRKILGMLFDMLKKAGVDPSNLESIKEFLVKLEKQDPDMAMLFEDTFNSLVSGDEAKAPEAPGGPMPGGQMPGGQGPGGQGPGGLMNKFKNLGQEMMMPRK